jgi:hypothetical protein
MSDYPIRVLSLGAGVQSTTLLRMCIAGEVEPITHAVFSDTGWEPRAVYDHLTKIRKETEAAGIEFHLVSQGNIRDDALNPNHRCASMPLHLLNENGQPAMGRRQCTSEYKLKPLLAKQREIAGLKPGQRCSEHRITTLIGISWDETQRMKDPVFPWIRNEYPLVDRRLTRQDCLSWNDRNGFDRPPRSSCIGCPFHSDKEWRAIKDDPEDWADAVEFDEALRDPNRELSPSIGILRASMYLHRKRIPLREVDLRTVEEQGQGTLFDMDCEGMCGL